MPILFGFVLDLAGGGEREAAWITAFAVQAALGASWPLAYLLGAGQSAIEREVHPRSGRALEPLGISGWHP